MAPKAFRRMAMVLALLSADLVTRAIFPNAQQQFCEAMAIAVGQPVKHRRLCLSDTRCGNFEQFASFVREPRMHDSTVLHIA